MTSRDLSRTEKPLASIDNIINSAHVPVYRRLKRSLRKKSMPLDAKLHLYDFETEGNENKGKRLKKSQKVRKRARIYVRHNKENTYSKGLKSDSNFIHASHKENNGVPVKSGIREYFQNTLGIAQRSVLREVQNQANVHDGYSPIDDDILSVTSEKCSDFTDEEGDFYGFSHEECHKANKSFFNVYGQEQSDFPSSDPRLQDIYLTNGNTDTPNPYMNFNPYKTPIKTSRLSFIPVIEFNESVGGNQLQPNRSSENLDLNHTFHNVSLSAADRFYSTPVKNNSFNSSSISNLSLNDLNITNCFGFEDTDDINEEFLMSPIKDIDKRPLRPKVRVMSPGPTRAHLPSVQEVIVRLKEGSDGGPLTTPDALFVPDVDYSPLKQNKINSYLDNSSLGFISQDLSIETEDEPKALKICETSNCIQVEPKVKPVRRSYERPLYLRNRKNSHHDDFDLEEQKNEPAGLDKTKNKKPQKNKKKVGPTKKEVDELEKWAQAFNSQCAQVDAFDLCIE